MAHKAKCNRCGWTDTATEGVFLAGTSSEESAKKRAAGHIGSCDGSWDDIEISETKTMAEDKDDHE